MELRFAEVLRDKAHEGADMTRVRIVIDDARIVRIWHEAGFNDPVGKGLVVVPDRQDQRPSIRGVGKATLKTVDDVADRLSDLVVPIVSIARILSEKTFKKLS